MTSDSQFKISGKDADGIGQITADGFLVKAGSKARREIVPSAKPFIKTARDELTKHQILKENGDQLIFVKDYLFRTPSGAAGVLLGCNANGWNVWKNDEGQTLSQVKRVSRGTDIAMLSPDSLEAIKERHEQLVNSRNIWTEQQLEQAHQLFKEKFGPSVLAALDGEALLSFMHDHGNRESLVYWLEFKSDEEFETRRFGSIAGGSALKFRVFRRKETGNWQAGGQQANRPKDITLEEAIEFARQHRDQLIAGCKLLDELPYYATDEQYAELQDQMDELATDVSRLAWGHKYFSLLYPNKLDDFHNADIQRYQLLKLLQLPPDGDGRYICAGRFVSLAKETGLSIHHLTGTLNALFGQPHKYWRIGTTSGKTGENFWDMMRERNRIAIGFSELGDLNWLKGNQESREKLKEQLKELRPNQAGAIGRACSQIMQFVLEVQEGDIVLAANGKDILGIGKVIGGYEYDPNFGFPHQREVEWLSTEKWQLPISSEVLRSTVREIRKYKDNLLAIEKKIQNPEKRIDLPIKPPVTRLIGMPGRIQAVLERKGQVILYGPPGTGKTHWAEKAAYDLASIKSTGRLFADLSNEAKQSLSGTEDKEGLVRMCCFHPGYGYEDFIEGYRPQTIDGQVSFIMRDGVFKRLCKDAINEPDRCFYLIIDEINRGDIPRIFGELITTLETDKRGKRILLPVSQESFSVPPNVFIIGTMNTADRSISLLDTALRRRFGFIEMMPDSSVLKDTDVKGIPLSAWFDAVNKRIRENVGRDARNLQIGHAYFLQAGNPIKDFATLKRSVRDDIIPLLEEYCYEDFETLAAILGDQLVDSNSQRIRHELFEDGQESSLVEALLAASPDISTSSDAVTSEESKLDQLDLSENEDDDDQSFELDV